MFFLSINPVTELPGCSVRGMLLAWPSSCWLFSCSIYNTSTTWPPSSLTMATTWRSTSASVSTHRQQLIHMYVCMYVLVVGVFSVLVCGKWLCWYYQFLLNIYIWLGLNVYVNLIFQKDTNCESILVHVPPTNELKFFKNIKVIIFIHYTYLYLVGVNFFGQVLISFFL